MKKCSRAVIEPLPVDDLLTAIRRRRSMGVARLRDEAVSREALLPVLEAARWAPSHGETEPWRFTIYTGDARQALGEAFAAAYRSDAEREGTLRPEVLESQRRRTESAPVWIALGMEPALRVDGSLKMTLDEERMACACAIQNLHLVACARGLAGMWLSQGVMIHPEVARFVGLTAPHAALLGFFVLGWPAIPWPDGERRPLDEITCWR
jgi:nitroreductase